MLDSCTLIPERLLDLGLVRGDARTFGRRQVAAASLFALLANLLDFLPVELGFGLSLALLDADEDPVERQDPRALSVVVRIVCVRVGLVRRFDVFDQERRRLSMFAVPERRTSDASGLDQLNCGVGKALRQLVTRNLTKAVQR